MSSYFIEVVDDFTFDDGDNKNHPQHIVIEADSSDEASVKAVLIFIESGMKYPIVISKEAMK